MGLGLNAPSALSVVVNAQADARRRASEEQGACIQAGDQHWPPQHTTGKSIAGLHGGLYCHGVRSKVQCSYRCGFPDASWFGCGGYQGDEGIADAQHHNITRH